MQNIFTSAKVVLALHGACKFLPIRQGVSTRGALDPITILHLLPERPTLAKPAKEGFVEVWGDGGCLASWEYRCSLA